MQACFWPFHSNWPPELALDPSLPFPFPVFLPSTFAGIFRTHHQNSTQVSYLNIEHKLCNQNKSLFQGEASSRLSKKKINLGLSHFLLLPYLLPNFCAFWEFSWKKTDMISLINLIISFSKKKSLILWKHQFFYEYLWSNQPDSAGRMICSWDYLTSTESLLGPPRNCLVNSLFTKIIIFLIRAKTCDNRLFKKLIRRQCLPSPKI